MKKHYLLTPGPTAVPESILASFAEPLIHHRTPLFKAVFSEVRAKLQWLYQTKQDVLMLTASGTGAMEAAIVNLFSPGQTVITLNAGKFGERWTKLAQAFGLVAVEIKASAPGETISAHQVREALEKTPHAKGVLWQASETSTGVKLPTEEICAVARAHPSAPLCVVDAITALGVFDLPMDTWGIDVLITGSQKALMIPPGLSFIALSQRAWAAAAECTQHKFYFDLKKERASQGKDQTAWTPAISLILGLNKALNMLQAEGMANVFSRHARAASATRQAVKALGLELLSERAPSDSVTAVKVPKEITDGKLIPKYMRDNQGVTIAGGQDELEGKIFRLSHLGYVDKFDILVGIGALEITLHKLGYTKFNFGAGTGAVTAAYAAELKGDK